MFYGNKSTYFNCLPSKLYFSETRKHTNEALNALKFTNNFTYLLAKVNSRLLVTSNNYNNPVSRLDWL